MERLLALLHRIKPGIDFEDVDDLLDSGILDSIDVYEIIEAISTEYGVVIEPKDIDPDNFMNANRIYDLIQRYMR